MHLLCLLTLAYLLVLYFDVQSTLIPVMMIILGAGLVLCQGYWHKFDYYIGSFGSQLAGYGLAMVLLALLILQVEHVDFLDGSGFVYSLIAIGVCVVGLIVSGETSGQLRLFAYTGFSLHVVYLSFVTVGTMLGTSGVFLICGLLIMGLAYLLTRMEKYMRRPSHNTSAAVTEGQSNG